MSDNESSYYEIALTNRQVLVAFVALLVLVLAVFLGGVWLGRGQQRPIGEDLMAAADTGDDQLGELEELSFFDSPGDVAAETEELDKPDLGKLEPHRDTTLAQDVERQPRSAQRDSPPPASPQAAPPPRRTPPPPAPAQSKPAQSKPAPSKPAPPTAAAADQFVVQVFSTDDEPQARKVLSRLTKAGYRAFLSPVEVRNRTMYRVRLGPFDQRSVAEKKGGEVNRKFKYDTWITAATN